MANQAVRPVRVDVVQDGARGHYGVPIALAKAGILGEIYTDFYCPPNSIHPWIAKAVRLGLRETGQRMLERHTDHLPTDPVRFGYANLFKQLRGKRRFGADIQGFWEWQARVQGEWILKHPIEHSTAVMGFVRNIDPQFCRAARQRGLTVVADQMIAPAAIELDELQKQRARFPGWETAAGEDILKRIDRFERDTWPSVDHLTCPSDYVRDGLIALGQPPEKVTTVHYPIDEAAYAFTDRRGRTGPVTVGFVGSVGLRKGVPFFFEMAKRFEPAAVRFVMVGPVQVDAGKVAENKGAVEVKGSTPRAETARLMKEFDLVYFPTTCEGSAYALMEAMSSGLPIVTSPNSGTVGRHGQEVFLTAYDDLDAAEAHLRRLIDDPELRWTMGAAAHARYTECDMAHYSASLRRVFSHLSAGGEAGDPTSM